MTKATGNIRYRFGWRGVLVVQIEEEHVASPMITGSAPIIRKRTWRDAKAEDLKTLQDFEK